MGEITSRFLITPMMLLVRVVAEHLPLALDIIKHSDFLASKLNHPNCTGISPSAGSTDIPEQFDRKDWIGNCLTDAALSPCVS